MSLSPLITPVTLWHMSGAGAMLILVAVVVRTLALNRLPKSTFPLLWGLALFRLLVPVAISCPWSIYGFLGRCFPALAERFATGSIAFPFGLSLPSRGGSPSTVRLSHAVTMTTQAAQEPLTFSVSLADRSSGNSIPLSTILLLLWLIGVAVCVVVFAVAYRRCWWLVQTSLPVDAPFAQQWLTAHSMSQSTNHLACQSTIQPAIQQTIRPLRWRTITIRQSSAVSSPLTYGVWHPVILMPQTTDWDDTDTLLYVLAHEYAHIRRWDALTKYAIIAALCLHWFNPLVWVLYHLANRDMELACDEAVIRQFGQEHKARYARTLIQMEEQKSRFIPFCSSFGKNNIHTIEERIVAIMKTSPLSRLSLGMTGALLVGVTTAFATAAQPASTPAAAQPGSATTSDVVTDSMQEDEVTITSYTDPETGVTSYQLDDGTTTRAMSEDELQTGYSYTLSNIEWWTYDEYKAWLDQEKVELQKMLGSHAWTSHDGDFVWTQEKIDETIAMYEDILQQIKDGLMISKTVDGKTDMVLAMGSDLSGEDVTITVTDDKTSEAVGSIDGQLQTSYTVATPSMVLESVKGTSDASDYVIQFVSYDEYAPYGLSYDPDKNELTYQGKLVRYFLDGVDLGDGAIASRAEFLNEDGIIDVHTIRGVIDNGDGSTDPFGPLQAIVPYSQAEFDSRDLSALTPSQEATTDMTVTVTKNKEAEADSGVTFAERFAAYKPYGITFEEGQVGKDGNESSVGQVYYNGTRVRKFVDVAPNGDTFTFNYALEEEAANTPTVNVKTVYDDKGNLTGVETF